MNNEAHTERPVDTKHAAVLIMLGATLLVSIATLLLQLKVTTLSNETSSVVLQDEGVEVKPEPISSNAIAMFNCEQSGGRYLSEGCECPDNRLPDGEKEFGYDRSTGYCSDIYGIPGGGLLKEYARLYQEQEKKAEANGLEQKR